MSTYETDLLRHALRQYTQCNLVALDTFLRDNDAFLFGEFVTLSLSPGDGHCADPRACLRVCFMAEKIPRHFEASEIQAVFPRAVKDIKGGAPSFQTWKIPPDQHILDKRIIEFRPYRHYNTKCKMSVFNLRYSNGNLNIPADMAQIVDTRIMPCKKYNDDDNDNDDRFLFQRFQYDVRFRDRKHRNCCKCRFYDAQELYVECRRCRSTMCTECFGQDPSNLWLQTRDGLHTFCYACMRAAILNDRLLPRDQLITVDFNPTFDAYQHLSKYRTMYTLMVIVMPDALTTTCDRVRVSVSAARKKGRIYTNILNGDFAPAIQVAQVGAKTFEISRKSNLCSASQEPCGITFLIPSSNDDDDDDDDRRAYGRLRNAFMVLNRDGLLNCPRPLTFSQI